MRVWVAFGVLSFLFLLITSGVPLAGAGGGSGHGAVTSPTAPQTKASSPASPTLGRSRLGEPAAGPSANPVLSLAGDSPAAIALEWTDTVPTGGTFENYTLLEASAASAWAFGTVGVVTAAGTTSYALAGISPSTAYDWEIAEHYETCFLGCTQSTDNSNVLNQTQPGVAFENYTGLTSTNATLRWTNNATYGGSISFENYTIWQEVNGSAPGVAATVTARATLALDLTLKSSTSYTFFIETTDCASGCTGSTPDLSVTQSNLITLGTPRNLSVTITAARLTVDFGEADYFTCTPTGGQYPFSYQWDFAGAGYVAGPASESVVLNALGATTVACKVTDVEPKTNETTVDIQVNPALVVIATSNRTTADADQSVAFECSVTGGTSTYALNWAFGDGSSSMLETVDYAYPYAGNYAPTCAVTDGAGVTEAPSISLSVSPALSLAAGVSSNYAAPGTVLTFTAVVTNGSGTYTGYNWTFAPGVTASGAEVTYAFPSRSDYTVTVQVGDSNGVNVTQSMTVDVSPVSASYSTVGVTAQPGANVTLSAVGSGGAGGPYNYSWQFGDGTVGYGATVTHAYASAGTYTPRLVVTDRLGANFTTTVASVTVVAPTPAFSWLTGWLVLAIALIVGAIISLVVLVRRRKDEAAAAGAASSAYVPPTDPKTTIQGAKVCSFCGATNLPLRTTCSHCGKPLPRGPVT